ncbi:gag-pol polyprotein, partial [Trifolium medium]|nr:gag-pol polyprotein [Trifolium medium]
DLTVSWSDKDDSEGELNNESAKHVTALTSRCVSDTESCDENVSYEELAPSYMELCVRSEEVRKLGEKHKRIIAQLQAEKSELLSVCKERIIYVKPRVIETHFMFFGRKR